MTEGHIGPLEDGHVYYMPPQGCGAMSAANLRDLATELDRQNALRNLGHCVWYPAGPGCWVGLCGKRQPLMPDGYKWCPYCGRPLLLATN